MVKIAHSSYDYNRRQILQGLGTAVAGTVVAEDAIGQDKCEQLVSPASGIIDSGRYIGSSARTLREAGVETVIRFYAREGGQWCGKVLTKDEVAEFDGENISVVIGPQRVVRQQC